MKRILAVDDEEFLLNVLKAVLSRSYEVMTAPDGPAAIEILKAGGVDLVITDLRMDPMNGLELLLNIRQEYPDLPVIMLTAYASAETANEARDFGCFAYLTKPFTGEEVMDTVQRALDERAKKDQRAALPEEPPPALADVVREYMTRAKLPNAFEAKSELADELYWLAQDHTKNSLLRALNDAVGWNYIQMEVIDALLEYRQTMVRAKQVLANRAKDTNTDPASLLADTARKAADAHVRYKGDDLRTAQYVCEELHVAHGTLGPAEMLFFRDYFESAMHQHASLTLTTKPPAAPAKPEAPAMPLAKQAAAPPPLTEVPPPPRPTGIRIALAAAQGAASADPHAAYVNQTIHKLRHEPVLTVAGLQNVLREVEQRTGGRADPAFKKVERVIDAHVSLTDLAEFYTSLELASLRRQGVPDSGLRELLRDLNALADSKEVTPYLHRTIQASPWKDALTTLASRYVKKRFGTKWATGSADPASP